MVCASPYCFCGFRDTYKNQIKIMCAFPILKTTAKSVQTTAEV